MISTYAKAYTEVLEILNHLPKHEYDKIPKSKIEFYNKNKDNEYVYVFDKTKELNKQKISREANAIIMTLFRDYFASNAQKEKLMNILNNNEIKRQQELEMKYNQNDLFKNKRGEENIQKNELIVYKKNIFSKILRRIRNFLKI